MCPFEPICYVGRPQLSNGRLCPITSMENPKMTWKSLMLISVWATNCLIHLRCQTKRQIFILYPQLYQTSRGEKMLLLHKTWIIQFHKSFHLNNNRPVKIWNAESTWHITWSRGNIYGNSYTNTLCIFKNTMKFCINHVLNTADDDYDCNSSAESRWLGENPFLYSQNIYK